MKLMNNKIDENLVDIEINLSEFTKESLIHLIEYAHKNSFTFNEAIVSILQTYIQSNNLKE